MNPLEPLIEGIESNEALDQPAKLVSDKVGEILKPGTLKDLISGTQIGHALHPMLTDVVIGSFTSATALDLIGGDSDGRAAERLIALGIAAYPPTALTGVSDWADSEYGNDSVRRIGLVHAATNGAALALYAASLAARRRGSRGKGVFLGLLGAGALGAGGYLGGHLTFAKGIGADQTIFDPGPTEWTDATGADELTAGEAKRVVVDDTPVLLFSQGDKTFAIHDRCSHRGCSLADGEIEDGVVTCPCHGSRFGLENGSLKKGPATQPQPAFKTRERDGRIEIRLAT